jgi:hypothetical protein
MKYQPFEISGVPTAQSSTGHVTPTRLASATAALLGIALASYGGYTQYSITAQAAVGACDSCTAWHPLFVVTPLLVGITLLSAGSYAFAKTTC